MYSSDSQVMRVQCFIMFVLGNLPGVKILSDEPECFKLFILFFFPTLVEYQPASQHFAVKLVDGGDARGSH